MTSSIIRRATSCRSSVSWPQGFVEFEAKGNDATPGNARELPFGIDATLGSVALMGANGALVDRGETQSQFRDTSTGRVPDGTGVSGSLAIRLRPAPPMSRLPDPRAGRAQLPAHHRNDVTIRRLQRSRSTSSFATSATSRHSDWRSISAASSFTNGITFTFPAGTTLRRGRIPCHCGRACQIHGAISLCARGRHLHRAGSTMAASASGSTSPATRFPSSTSTTLTIGTLRRTAAAMPCRSSAQRQRPAMWEEKEGWQASPPNPGTVPAYSVYAGPDIAGPAGVPLYLDGALNPGTFTPSAVSLAWTGTPDRGPSLSPPATTRMPMPRFPLPGVYVLRLTGTAPGPVIVTDLTTVVVQETYDMWAARVLASQSAANRLPQADPDRRWRLECCRVRLERQPAQRCGDWRASARAGWRIALLHMAAKSDGRLRPFKSFPSSLRTCSRGRKVLRCSTP